MRTVAGGSARLAGLSIRAHTRRAGAPIVLGALSGVISCEWLWPTSNFCGAVPLLLALPLAIVGGLAGYLYSRRPADRADASSP